jgi:hypothetical protein
LYLLAGWPVALMDMPSLSEIDAAKSKSITAKLMLSAL